MTGGARGPLLPVPFEADRRSRLASELRRLGPVYLRIGHHLATRPDIVGQRDRHALVALGDHVPAAPWADVRAGLMAELGTDPAAVFGSVEQTALWANATTQVHRARLLDGTRVTVKLVRPNAAQEVAKVLQRLPEELPPLLADSSSSTQRVEPATLVDEVTDWLEHQLDLSIEAAVLVRLRPLAAGSRWEHVPRLLVELCTRSLLVHEERSGLTASEAATAAPERLRDAGVDPVRAARALMTVTFRQAFRYQLFQADLHPDNVILLPRDAITYADWSSFAELDSGLAEDELAYLTAVFDADVERALDPPTDLVAFDDEGDIAAFRRDVLSHLRERATVEAGQRPQSAPLELLAELLRAARAHRIGLSEGGRLLFRAVVAAGATAERLDADVATTDVTRRALGAARVGGKIRQLQPDRVERTVFDLARLLRDTPAHLHKILSELADGSFSMNVWVAEVAQAERNRNRRARLLVAAIASVSLAVVLTAPHFASVDGVSLAWPIALALALVYGWLALEWRRLR